VHQQHEQEHCGSQEIGDKHCPAAIPAIYEDTGKRTEQDTGERLCHDSDPFCKIDPVSW